MDAVSFLDLTLSEFRSAASDVLGSAFARWSNMTFPDVKTKRVLDQVDHKLEQSLYDTSLFLDLPVHMRRTISCMRCKRVCRAIVEATTCGHVFCKQCVDVGGDAADDDPKPFVCPCCMRKTAINDAVALANMIQGWPVRCVNHKTCKWKGAFSALHTHVRTCGRPHTVRLDR